MVLASCVANDSNLEPKLYGRVNKRVLVHPFLSHFRIRLSAHMRSFRQHAACDYVNSSKSRLYEPLRLDSMIPTTENNKLVFRYFQGAQYGTLRDSGSEGVGIGKISSAAE